MIKSRQNSSTLHQELIKELENNQDFLEIKKIFPHISQHILEMWGTNQLHTYMTNLFNDTRDGKRQGFPQEISNSLFRILRYHDDHFHPVEKPQTSLEMWATIENKNIFKWN